MGGVIITSKNPSTTKNQAVEEVKSKIDPKKIGLGVSLRPCYKGNGCFLGTNRTIDGATVEGEILNQLGDEFSVRTPVQKKPQLLLSGVNREYSEEEMAREIVSNNPGFNDEERDYKK